MCVKLALKLGSLNIVYLTLILISILDIMIWNSHSYLLVFFLFYSTNKCIVTVCIQL